MSKWFLRGLVFAALMVFIRLVQGALINAWETKALLISITLVVIFAAAAAIWGFVDGRADARANPDPDRREDLAMTWLLAGLFAGIVSGAVSWLISLFYKGLYVGGLVNELTTFAAFTALLTFVMAIAGTALGHWVIDRHVDDTPRKRHGYAAEGEDDDRADTDVFAAVRHPDARDERDERTERDEDAPTERRGQERP
jgi:MFS family permease